MNLVDFAKNVVTLADFSRKPAVCEHFFQQIIQNQLLAKI